MGKGLHKSKTVGLNTVLPLLAFCPQVEHWITHHPQKIIGAICGVNLILRVVTKDKLQIGMPNLKNLKLIFILALLLPNIAFGFAKKAVDPDAVTKSTILNGDATSMVEGCGQQPIVGFTYCRVTEGDTAAQGLWFIGPPAECNRDQCVFIKVYNEQGQVAWGGAIPKGHTRVFVPWSTLVSRATFQVGDRGFWSFNTQVFWLDSNQKENSSTSQGDILLRIYSKGYIPLNAVKDDPNFAWEWSEGGHTYKVTAGLRAYIK